MYTRMFAEGTYGLTTDGKAKVKVLEVENGRG